MRNQRITRRGFLQLTGGSAALAMLAACAPAAPGAAPAADSGSAAPAQQAVAVTYWAHDFAERAALDKIYIEQFMKDHPEITVSQEMPGDYDTALPTALAAGTAGDLFAHSNRFMAEYQRQGAIAPVLYEAIGMQQAEFLDKYIEAQNTLDGGTFDGELYGIPNEVSIYALHINNGLFQEAGLDPEKDYPKTWTEFTEIAEKLTKRDASGQLVQRGAQVGWKSPGIASNIFGGQLRQIGGAEVTDDFKKAAINSEQGAQTLSWWKYFSDNNLDGPQYSQDQGDCLQGNIAMWMNTGSWRRQGLLDAKIEYTVLPAPRWENNVNDRGFYTYAYYHMANSQSAPEVQSAAWQLAWALDTHPDAYLDKAGLLQTQKVVLDSDAYKNTPFLNVFLDEEKIGTYAPKAPGWTQIIDVLDRMRDQVVAGTSVEEALTTASNDIDDVLEEAWKAIS